LTVVERSSLHYERGLKVKVVPVALRVTTFQENVPQIGPSI
jgi:hypothetical protein